MLRALATMGAAIRSAVAIVVVVLYTAVLGTYLIILAKFRPTSPHIDAAARHWGRVCCAVCGARATIEGLDTVDTTRSCVFVSNHISGLDPPFHLAFVPVGIRFLAKKELFKVPIFGPAMRAIGMVETDRQARAAAHRKINEQVARVIEMGRSLIIYPEGTRSRDGELHPFKKGAFRIAVDNGMPVVPITIAGLDKVWQPDSKIVRRGRAIMVFHEAIPTADLKIEDIEDLQAQVHSIIGATYEQIRYQVSAAAPRS
jgi:1-acyl-sn-glycerol-3-phosphate acyltransferase